MEQATTKLEVAMLRVSIALRKQPQATVEDVSSAVAKDMKINPLSLRAYIAEHMKAFVRTTK